MKGKILKVLVGMLLLLGGSPGLGASKDDEDHKRRYQSLIRMAPNDASRDAEVIAKRLGTDVPALIKALKDENPSVRRVASDTLGTMGANGGEKLLHRAG